MMKHGRTTAIVLAAGQGKRMGSDIQKQYMRLNGKPLIYYAIQAFEQSEVDAIVLVVGSGEIEYCKKEIIDCFKFKKVGMIVEGGKERYHSVYEGLKAVESCELILIHDGARPLITPNMIRDAMIGARSYGACVIGMPVKDTIKISDGHDYACDTPDRNLLWMIQTPQAFSYSLILDAYTKLFENKEHLTGITDDAMVVEAMTDVKVKLIPGSYSNLKVTTPEDIAIAKTLLDLAESGQLS